MNKNIAHLTSPLKIEISSEKSRSKRITEFPFEKIFISKFSGCQTKEDAAIRTHNILAVFSTAAYILQVSAASNCFHVPIREMYTAVIKNQG